MTKTKKQSKQPVSKQALAAVIAKQIADAQQMTDDEFKFQQQQCQMVTNMCYSMADSLDGLIADMEGKCRIIHDELKHNEKRYFNLIKQGVHGIRSITERATPFVAEAYANEADIVAHLHKLMYDRCTTNEDWYTLFMLMLAMPSKLGYKFGEGELKHVFGHLHADKKQEIENRLKTILDSIHKL